MASQGPNGIYTIRDEIAIHFESYIDFSFYNEFLRMQTHAFTPKKVE